MEVGAAAAGQLRGGADLAAAAAQGFNDRAEPSRLTPVKGCNQGPAYGGPQAEGDAADAGEVVGEAEVGDQGRGLALQDAGEDQARAGQQSGGLGVDLGELARVAGDGEQALGVDGEAGGGGLGAVGEEVEVLAAWSSGRYRVAILPTLEDSCGNRVSTPFEVPAGTCPRGHM